MALFRLVTDRSLAIARRAELVTVVLTGLSIKALWGAIRFAGICRWLHLSASRCIIDVGFAQDY